MKPKHRAEPSGKTQQQILTLIPSAVTEEMSRQGWWNNLDDETKAYLQKVGPTLASDLVSFGQARFQVAKRLAEIYERLRPTKQFERFIKFYRLKRRTVYRAIKDYDDAKSLPAPIVAAANATGVNILGDKLKQAMKKLPWPKEAEHDGAVAVEYVENLDKVRRSLPKPSPEAAPEPEVLGPQEPKDLMRECYRFISVRYHRLPSDLTPAKKAAWLRTLSGMLLQLTGVSGEQSLAVIAPPPDFKAVRGRPRIH